jgi:serine/threonine protein kinase
MMLQAVMIKTLTISRRHLQRLIGVGCFKTGTKREIASSLYLVEEITGQWSLFKMLRTRKLQPEHPHTQWSQEVALGWCIEIAEGLSFLHNNGIVHRDIKPENITMTDTEVFLTEARIADLKPIRRNFRKNAHLHASPVVQPSSLLPDDDPEVMGGSIEDFQLSPDAIKLTISHDHKQDEEGQCSLLKYHRTMSSSLELQTSLQGAYSNTEEAFEQPIIQPAADSNEAGLLGHHITSGIDAALTSLTTAYSSQTPSIPFKKSSLPTITSDQSMLFSNSSDMTGLKSPSGRKMANSSSSSVNLGQEKWANKLATVLQADEEEEEEDEVEDEGHQGISVAKDVTKHQRRSHTGAKELPSPMDPKEKGPLRILSTPAVLPRGGQKPSALKNEGAPPRRANLRVRFDTNFTNAEGLAPAEDYSLLYAAPEYMRNM